MLNTANGVAPTFHGKDIIPVVFGGNDYELLRFKDGTTRVEVPFMVNINHEDDGGVGGHLDVTTLSGKVRTLYFAPGETKQIMCTKISKDIPAGKVAIPVGINVVI
jgi:hypothetical protein